MGSVIIKYMIDGMGFYVSSNGLIFEKRRDFVFQKYKVYVNERLITYTLYFGGIMSKLIKGRLEGVFRFLENLRVFTLEQVISSLNCSVPTARVKLRQWHAHTSYNQNGRYYAMPTVPRFDENGLWHFEKVSFSRYGNLKRTVVYLINASSSGLTGNEIGDLVRLRPQSFLHHFRDVAGIRREKTEGVYVYYSGEANKYKEQIQNRSEGLISDRDLLSDGEAIVVLTALIRHHGISVDDIMKFPEVRERGLSEAVIRNFLNRHDLLKKTPATKP